MNNAMSENHPPEDRKLAEQLAKTGDLMDLCFDETWLRESAAAEEASGGYVEAGLMMREYVARSRTVSHEQIQQMRLQSILFTELQHWMSSWQLGLSFEATYTQARQLIRQHLQALTPEQQTWVDSLLAEDEQVLEASQKVIRSQAITMMSQMFTQEDWQILADTAAQGMAEGILQVRHWEAISPITA
ncbi:hypothetical protein PN498_22215 [Oscillatoria sp. CS-180]|uniref:hypothetical protein n=1 Tax=Oscillatoria sp. CS-180 TaxID=3021720 RepID=UPI00232DD685|nr:hypothetical protein [Oscillatoria sp. CS-180]MDB9528724.1 hypothetical protein [Oscillatoria sp. CS-180]